MARKVSITECFKKTNRLLTISRSALSLKSKSRLNVSKSKATKKKKKFGINSQVGVVSGKGKLLISSTVTSEKKFSLKAYNQEDKLLDNWKLKLKGENSDGRKSNTVFTSVGECKKNYSIAGSSGNANEVTDSTGNLYPESWTKEMIQYYFEPDEKLRHFNYLEILDSIKFEPSDWWISDADRMNTRKKNHYLRCAKCNQRGHHKKDCKKCVVCYVCGNFNHSYSNCPNTLCFTCGRATKKYLKNCLSCRTTLSIRKRCSLCGQIWHEEALCPSKWRRYSILRSSEHSNIRPNTMRCCYNCAEKGHFGFECPQTLESDYPPENPFKTAFPNGLERENIDNDVFHHVIFLTKQTSDVLSAEKGRQFLRDLSENMNIRIELFRGKRCYIKLVGDDEITNYCRAELFRWKLR